MNNQSSPLQLDEELMAQMLDASDYCIQMVDAQGRFLFYSRGAERMEGLRRENVVGSTVSQLYWTEDYVGLAPDSSLILQVLEERRPLTATYNSYIANGRRFNIIADVQPVFRDGELLGAIAIFREASKAKKDSIAIIEREKQMLLKRQDVEQTIFRLEDIICGTPNMSKSLDIARRAAEHDMPVMIEGETGTGKEMFAQGIHNQRYGPDAPFVAVNCAAIPESLLESELFGTSKGAFTGAVEKPGLLEKAENGSFFLDEVNSMPIHLQSKLLRALQTRSFMRVGGKREQSFNARIISAINCDPGQAIRNHQLREDIYYRLAVMYLKIPPLRERPGCVPLLLEHFTRQANETLGKHLTGLSAEVAQMLADYDWPGNVRELEHMVAYSGALADYEESAITLDLIPPYITKRYVEPAPTVAEASLPLRAAESLNLQLKHYEEQLILAAAQSRHGNITQMAAALGVSRQNLQHRLKRLGLEEKLQSFY